MVERYKPKKRIMRDFQLREISSVDRPAQEGALATIMKRQTEDLVDAITKRWIDPQDGAVAFSTVMSANRDNKRYCEVSEEASPAINALETSLRSIVADPNVDPTTKQAMMRASVEDCLAELRANWPDIEQALVKEFTNTTGDEEMNKTVEDLEKQIADIVKAAAAKDEQVTALTAKLDEATKTAEADKAALAEATAKAAMSDAEKTHMATLKDDKAKAAFMAMKADERKKAMAKMAEEDEVLKIAGQEIRKSAVGDAHFAIMKAQAEQIAKAEADIAKERDLRESAELSKRAEDELGHLPGESVAKVSVLKAVSKMEKAVADTLTAMLSAGDKAISAAYGKLGHRDGDVGKGSKAFEKRVTDIRNADSSLSRTAALEKARKDYPEEFKAYQDSGQAN